MKIKLIKQQIVEIIADPEIAQEIGIKTTDPW